MSPVPGPRMDRGPKYGYQFLTHARRLLRKRAAEPRGSLMQWRGVRRARGASWRNLSRTVGVLAVAALAGSVAGCSSLPSDGRASLASGASSGSTLAFESIDGPPPEVFRKLVANLNDEAGARQIAVVSRTGSRNLSRARLCLRAGRARQDHLRLGLGRLRHRQAADAAHRRRGACRGRRPPPRRLGRRRRAGAAPHGPRRHGADRGLPQRVRARADRSAGAIARDAGLRPR